MRTGAGGTGQTCSITRGGGGSPSPLAVHVGAIVVLALAFGMQAIPPDSLRTSLDARLPAEQAVADTVIEARLDDVFSVVDELDSVRVEVRSGVVNLSGTVVNPEAAETAVQIARQFEGVVFVNDQIEAETDVGTRVSPALENIRAYADNLLAYLPLFGVALFVVALFGLFSFILKKWDTPRRVLGINPLVWDLIRRITRAFIFLIGLILAFDILGITTLVGAGLGAAGIAGLAVGFAFKDIVENYLAGMLMSIRRPFDVNDHVRIEPFEGRVVRLTSRDLLLLTLDGNHVRLPNAMVFKSAIVNYTRNPRRLFLFDVGISMGEDLSRAMTIGTNTIKALNGVLSEPPPFAFVKEISDSWMRVRYHGWVDQQHANYYKVESEAIRLVKEALDREGVELPSPGYRIQLSREDGRPQPRPGSPAVEREAESADTAPDGRIDEQVYEELSNEDEKNLLTDDRK